MAVYPGWLCVVLAESAMAITEHDHGRTTAEQSAECGGKLSQAGSRNTSERSARRLQDICSRDCALAQLRYTRRGFTPRAAARGVKLVLCLRTWDTLRSFFCRLIPVMTHGRGTYYTAQQLLRPPDVLGTIRQTTVH